MCRHGLKQPSEKSGSPRCHSTQLCEGDQTDLQVLWEVVEENDLQQQFLPSDNAGRKIQGQEEILEHRELQEDHMETVHCFIGCKQQLLTQ